MVIAAAQMASEVGAISQNMHVHSQLIKVAASYGVDTIVFPELSVTGYTRELKDELIFKVEDKRFILFQQLAKQYGMTIVVGAPFKNANDTVHIASFIFSENEKISVHTKKYLHEGEAVCFSPGTTFSPQYIKGKRIDWAICADITHPEHAKEAAENKCDIYAASVFITPEGYKADCDLLIDYAKNYNMLVVMANFAAGNQQYDSAGKSAIWDNLGKEIANFKGRETGLLIAYETKNGWKGKTIQTLPPLNTPLQD